MKIFNHLINTVLALAPWSPSLRLRRISLNDSIAPWSGGHYSLGISQIASLLFRSGAVHKWQLSLYIWKDTKFTITFISLIDKNIMRQICVTRFNIETGRSFLRESFLAPTGAQEVTMFFFPIQTCLELSIFILRQSRSVSGLFI